MSPGKYDTKLQIKQENIILPKQRAIGRNHSNNFQLQSDNTYQFNKDLVGRNNLSFHQLQSIGPNQSFNVGYQYKLTAGGNASKSNQKQFNLPGQNTNQHVPLKTQMINTKKVNQIDRQKPSTSKNLRDQQVLHSSSQGKINTTTTDAGRTTSKSKITN